MSIRLASPRRGGKTKTKRTALIPAAARIATAFTEHELDLSGDAIETFARVVGGRKKLLATLAIADSDASTDKVINCLLDDEFDTWSLRKICTYAGITVADLFASYKKALFVQAHIDAAHRITEKLPPIIDDVMARALPQPVECPRCHGAPTTPSTKACPTCEGKGTILGEPALARQKLALELGHLIEHKAGIVMQQNTAVAAAATALTAQGPGSLEQLQQVVGELLFSPGRRRTLAPIEVARAPRADVQDPREPAPPVDDPRPDLPLPVNEPEDDDDVEEDEDEDDEPLNAG